MNRQANAELMRPTCSIDEATRFEVNPLVFAKEANKYLVQAEYESGDFDYSDYAVFDKETASFYRRCRGLVSKLRAQMKASIESKHVTTPGAPKSAGSAH